MKNKLKIISLVLSGLVANASAMADEPFRVDPQTNLLTISSFREFEGEKSLGYSLADDIVNLMGTAAKEGQGVTYLQGIEGGEWVGNKIVSYTYAMSGRLNIDANLQLNSANDAQILYNRRNGQQTTVILTGDVANELMNYVALSYPDRSGLVGSTTVKSKYIECRRVVVPSAKATCYLSVKTND